jgi:hypothetical protein
MKLELPAFLEKYLGHITALRATAASRNLLNPSRDWYMALLFCVAFSVVLLSVSIAMFFAVGTDTALYTQTDSGVGPSLDRSLLRETLTFFKGEEDEFVSLRATRPSIPAPL